MRRFVVATLAAAALFGAPPPALADFNAFKGAWATSAETCATPVVTVTAATARAVRVSTRMGGQLRDKDVDFDASTPFLSVMLSGADGEPRFIGLTPKNGAMVVDYKRAAGPPQETFGALTLKAGASATLVRCPDAGVVTAAASADPTDWVAAMTRFQTTFGVDWLDGSWGGVDKDFAPIGLSTPPSCRSEGRAWRQATKSTRTLSMGSPREITAPDGTKVMGEGAWHFFVAKDGKRYAAPRDGRLGPIEVWASGRPGVLGVTLPEGGLYAPGGRRLVTATPALIRSNEAGVWANIGAQAPVKPTTYNFVLKLENPDKPGDVFYLTRCRAVTAP